MRLLGGVALAGCSAATQSVVIEKGMRSDTERHRAFEAVLQMLDRNPDYVDEFFALARKHPAALERFTVDETRALADPKLARLMAMYLRDQPASVREIVTQLIEHIDQRPEAQKALADAIEAAFKDPHQRQALKETLKQALKGD